MIKNHLAFGLSFLLFLFSFSQINAQSRPNILVVIADDMGRDAMSEYGIGAQQPNTPNLNSLMSQGIKFNNVWSYPTCAPSRASLLTGRYGNKTGLLQSGPNLPNSEVTLFEQISTITNGEYSDALFGKWHLGGPNTPNTQGVDRYVGGISSGVTDYFNWERTEDGVTNISTEYVTSHITSEAINWIDQQSSPWFLWVAHNAPHGPIHLPPDSLYTRTQTGGNLNKYLCMIESVDHEVGRLYNSLTQAEKDSTILVFVGDNGTPNNVLQGYPDGHGKSTLYEGGIGVPMFVMGYGVDRINEEENALINFTDLFATITEMLGNDLPGGVDNSFSFYALLSDSNAATRPYSYSEQGTTDTDKTIRNEEYKLIDFANGTQEFYDLINDPLETVNLLDNGLSDEELIVLDELKTEADSVFVSWSCNDDIQNGEEEDIDCGSASCAPCTTGISDLKNEKAAVSIFPNPAFGQINLKSQTEKILEVEVFNSKGERLILKSNINSFDAILDVKSLNPQVYFIKIRTESNISVEKFLKI